MKPEKIVYFVRHGQSEANAGPVFQSPNSPLSETGRKQATSIARRIAKLSFEALIVSPFQRTKETAEAISKATGKKPEYSELMVERAKPSVINDKPHADQAASTLWEKWEESIYTPGRRVEDGENFDDLLARADQALVWLSQRPESSLVVVTHGFFLRTIVARVLLGDFLSGDTFRRFQSRLSIENTGLTVLRYRGPLDRTPGWHLWVYNDHAHLG